MKDKINNHTIGNDINYVKEYISSQSPINVEFVNGPLITKEKIPFTQQDLDNLKRTGAVIFEFENEYICQKYKNYTGTSPIHPKFSNVQKNKILENSKLYGGKTKTKTKYIPKTRNISKKKRTRNIKI